MPSTLGTETFWYCHLCREMHSHDIWNTDIRYRPSWDISVAVEQDKDWQKHVQQWEGEQKELGLRIWQSLVSQAAIAQETYGDDELERYAEEQRKREEKTVGNTELEFEAEVEVTIKKTVTLSRLGCCSEAVRDGLSNYALSVECDVSEYDIEDYDIVDIRLIDSLPTCSHGNEFGSTEF